MKSDPAEVLRQLWNHGRPDVSEQDLATIGSRSVADINTVINGLDTFLAFRYILPAQLLAKQLDSSRNTLSLQARSRLPGSFDARSFCKDYICAFDRENYRVLGGSDDPLVGNIGRRPDMDAEWLAVGQRAQQGGRELIDVLSRAQDEHNLIEPLLRITLRSIADRLARTRIIYPRPNRISLAACESLVANFLEQRTGGRRLQAVTAALFDTIGLRFGLFAEVKVGHVNKADAVRGDVADLDCQDATGHTLLAVEVKDRRLSIREVENTLRVARDRGVVEILYAIRGGIDATDAEELCRLQERQFSAGHNVYALDFDELLRPCLVLFAENGRLEFVEAIGRRIDAMSELIDRQTWQRLVEQI